MWPKSFCRELIKISQKDHMQKEIGKALRHASFSQNVGKPSGSELVRGLSPLKLRTKGSKARKLEKLEIK